MQKDRVQALNPKTRQWTKIDTLTGRILGYRSSPFPDVMTVEERNAAPDHQRQLAIRDILRTHRFMIDPKYARKYIICVCGHPAREHQQRTGCCNHETGCDCTWYRPNHDWVLKQQIKQAEKILEDKQNGHSQ